MADPEELTPSGAQPPGDGRAGRQSRQRVKRDHFDVLCDKLTSGTLLGVKAVAEACLQFATKATGRGHLFDSAVVRDLDVRRDLAHIIGGHRQSGFAPQEVSAIADVLKRSTNKPLAAWCVAHLISIAVSQNFTQPTDTQPLYRLKHLQAFPVIAHGCNTLYKRKSGLSTRSGYERRQYDPSTVSGLSLWWDDRSTRPFKVDIDRAAGDEFNRGLDNNNTLRIALVQLNRTLFDLCIETISDESVNDPHFAGLHPKNEQAQIDSACKRLNQAAAANAGIALLPELAMTETAAKDVAAALATPGKVIPENADDWILRVAVTGSFHHVDGQGEQRNSTFIELPRTANPPLQPRQHSKSGAFHYKSARVLLELIACVPERAAAAQKKLSELSESVNHNMEKLTQLLDQEEQDFREKVCPSYEIRVYLGSKFSVVVVICADVLNGTIRNVIRALSPSLVLVCNMTKRLDNFVGFAHDLIVECQTTLVSVNNPAQHWPDPVKGALVGMPLQKHQDRILEEDFADGEIVVFDVPGCRLERWSGGSIVSIKRSAGGT